MGSRDKNVSTFWHLMVFHEKNVEYLKHAETNNWKNDTLHGIIWSCTIIKFANYLSKPENFGYFNPFLTKHTACTNLLDPAYALQFDTAEYLHE